MKAQSIVVRVNGSSKAYKSWKELMAEILGMMPNLEYWSFDALRGLYYGALEMMGEAFNVGRSQSIVRLFAYRPATREAMLGRIYETILSAEGKGLLHGFGITNQFKDNIPGDPERQSLRDVENRRMGK